MLNLKTYSYVDGRNQKEKEKPLTEPSPDCDLFAGMACNENGREDH